MISVAKVQELLGTKCAHERRQERNTVERPVKLAAGDICTEQGLLGALPSNSASITFPPNACHGCHRLPSPGNLLSLHVFILTPTQSPCMIICSFYNKNKEPSRNSGGSRGSSETNVNEKLLVTEADQTTSSRCQWFCPVGVPGKSTTTLSLSRVPVIFKQDDPHHTASTSFSALFITSMLSFAEQALTYPSLGSLLYNICRLVF